MASKVYVTGSSGLVGSRFVELYSQKYKLLTLEIDRLNILDFNSLKEFISVRKPNAVVHFAAFTDVSAAENQRGDENSDCFGINVLGTENLVKLCEENKIFMIHISTDMVFPGSEEYKGPYDEDDKPENTPDKLTWYGFTKSEAERRLLSILPNNSAILRIIYPVRASFERKLDYLRKPLSLFDQGKLYPLFDDQQISVSFIDEVALAIDKILEDRISGVYHCSSVDTTTPFEIVSYLIEKARGKGAEVRRSSLAEFLKSVGNSLRYPRWGGLKVEKTQGKLNIKFSTWRQIVDKLIEQGIRA